MSEPATAPRRPVIVTIAVALIYISALTSAVTGVFILLSRYRVAPEAVLPISLLGAAVILFGLLTLAVGSGVSRGSHLSRVLVSVYLGAAIILHIVTITSTDVWDWSELGFIVVDLFIAYALWAPPGSRFFAAVRAAQRAVEASTKG